MGGARKKVGRRGHRGFLNYLLLYYTRPQAILSMSSRKSGQTGFATKSMFDVLQNDEPEEEEVEEEEVALDQVIEYVSPFYLYLNGC
jgi:hypothetical protein